MSKGNDNKTKKINCNPRYHEGANPSLSSKIQINMTEQKNKVGRPKDKEGELVLFKNRIYKDQKDSIEILALELKVTVAAMHRMVIDEGIKSYYGG